MDYKVRKKAAMTNPIPHNFCFNHYYFCKNKINLKILDFLRLHLYIYLKFQKILFYQCKQPSKLDQKWQKWVKKCFLGYNKSYKVNQFFKLLFYCNGYSHPFFFY